MADVAVDAPAFAVDHPTEWVPTDSFAIRLWRVRRDLKLTQIEAAQRCGFHKTAWDRWEHGVVPRQIHQVVATISDTFGVDRNWLMWGRRCQCGLESR